MIKIIEGYHLTQTEKKYISHLIESGIYEATNKTKTKYYKIEKTKDENQYNICVGSKGTWNIGEGIKWVYDNLIIEFK